MLPPIGIAAKQGHFEVVKILLSFEAVIEVYLFAFEGKNRRKEIQKKYKDKKRG